MPARPPLSPIAPRAAALSFAALALVLAPAAEGSVGIDDAMKKTAGRVHQWMTETNVPQVAVGRFSAPPQFDAAGGPGLKQSLVKHLETLGAAVGRRAPVGLTGSYTLAEDDLGRPVAEVRVAAVDDRGRELISFTIVIDDEKDFAAAFGLTFEAPANASGRERAKVQEEAFDKPHAHVPPQPPPGVPPPPGGHDAVCRPTKGSPFGVEILAGKDRNHLSPRPVTLDGGVPFVELRKGEVYAVKVHNDAPHDAAVTLHVDGIPVFAFSESPHFKHFVVKSGSAGVIPGWHRNNHLSDAFKLTAYADSASQLLGDDGAEVGQITATFAAAWPKGSPPPFDERAGTKSLGRRGDVATGFGPEVATNFKTVERETGKLRAAVTIRYLR